jgi:iron complex outermembrane receptor protein
LHETRKNFGIFGSLDYDITDQLTASVEGRWNKDQLIVNSSGFVGSPPVVVDQKQKFSKFMPRLILSYRPTDALNVYTSWSRSFAPGQNSNVATYNQLTGFNLDIGTFTPTQKLDAYEIGIKHQAADWLNYSVSGYYYKWLNQAFGEVTLLPSGTAANVNAPGSTRVYGIEFETQAALSDWFDLTGSVTYNDIAFISYAASGSVITQVLTVGLTPPKQPGEIVSAAGARGRYIPNWRANVTGRVAVNELMGMERPAWIQVTGVMVGNFSVEQLDYNIVKGYWKFNARAGVEINENFSVEIYGNNITNDLSYGQWGGTTTYFGSPNSDRKSFSPLPEKREIGIQLSTKF